MKPKAKVGGRVQRAVLHCSICYGSKHTALQTSPNAALTTADT
jgi:hypothetical protein